MFSGSDRREAPAGLRMDVHPEPGNSAFYPEIPRSSIFLGAKIEQNTTRRRAASSDAVICTESPLVSVECSFLPRNSAEFYFLGGKNRTKRIAKRPCRMRRILPFSASEKTLVSKIFRGAAFRGAACELISRAPAAPPPGATARAGSDFFATSWFEIPRDSAGLRADSKPPTVRPPSVRTQKRFCRRKEVLVRLPVCKNVFGF